MRGRDQRTTKRARSLRRVDNDAEAALWSELRNRRLNGFKFVRQHPIGPYFADFACRAVMLVVEVDGSQHAGSRSDGTRDRFMNGRGWSVARFWHIDVLTDMTSVLETLVAILEGRIAKPVRSPDFSYLPGTAVS